MATGANLQDLQDLLKFAEEAVEVIKDDEWKRIAFERVLDYLLKKADNSQAVGAHPPAPPVNDTPPPVDSAFASKQQRIDAIAEYFGIDPEQVTDIFDVSDEDPGLIIHSSKLPVPQAPATRHIALLITGVRTALGRDTDTGHLRQVADDYSRLSSSNFMTTLAKMSELSLLGKRGSQKRLVRMKVRGAEEARELAKQLVGE